MAVKYASDLAAIVRQHRKLSGLSQSALARLAGVGKTAVFDLEHGKESMRLETVIKILTVLNLKISFELPTVHQTPDIAASESTTTRTQ